MDVGVVGVLVGRHEHARPVGPHLVHVVGDLRLQLAVDVEGEPGLLLREHEPVAVVVVPGVVMVEVGIGAVVVGAPGVVPVVDDQVLAVRVLRGHHQQHHVVENLGDLRRLLRGHAVGQLDDGLGVADLGRVDRRVEEVERHPFAGQGRRVGLGQAARVVQPVVDLDEAVEAREVARRTDRRQDVGVAQRARAALLVRDPVRAVREEPQVLENPGIARHLAVGPDLEAEVVGRMRDVRGLRGGGGRRRDRQHDDPQDGSDLLHGIAWGPATGTGCGRPGGTSSLALRQLSGTDDFKPPKYHDLPAFSGRDEPRGRRSPGIPVP